MMAGFIGLVVCSVDCKMNGFSNYLPDIVHEPCSPSVTIIVNVNCALSSNMSFAITLSDMAVSTQISMTSSTAIAVGLGTGLVAG
jgi:hypothetical protein